MVARVVGNALVRQPHQHPPQQRAADDVQHVRAGRQVQHDVLRRVPDSGRSKLLHAASFERGQQRVVEVSGDHACALAHEGAHLFAEGAVGELLDERRAVGEVRISTCSPKASSWGRARMTETC